MIYLHAATLWLLLFFNRKFFLRVCLLLFAAPGIQAADTTILFNHNLLYAEGRSLKSGVDGSLYFVGYAEDSTGKINSVLTKLDNHGTIIWYKSFGDTATNQALGLNFSADGNLVIVGERVLNGNIDFEVTLFDTSGNLIWTRRHGAVNKNESLQYITSTVDNGFLACGFTTQSNLISNDILLVKFDSLGSIQWQREYGTPRNDYGKMLRVTDDGKIAISGDSHNGRDVDNLLVLADADGNEIWQRFAGDANDNGNQALIINHDGHLILCGESTTAGNFNFDIYLAAFDTAGIFLWSRYIGGDGSEAGFSIVENGLNNYFITGYSTSIFPGAPYTAYLLKLDSAFHPVGLKFFPQPNLTICYEAILTSDSTLVLAGTSGTDFCLIFTNDNSYSENFIEHDFVSDIATDEKSPVELKVYFAEKDVLFFRCDSPHPNSEKHVTIYTADGRLISTTTFNQEVCIGLHGISPQLLFWCLDDYRNQSKAKGKLFKP